MKDFTKTLGAKVDDQTYAECTVLAKKLGLKKSDFIRNAINSELSRNKSNHTKQEQPGMSLPGNSSSILNRPLSMSGSNYLNRGAIFSSGIAENILPCIRCKLSVIVKFSRSNADCIPGCFFVITIKIIVSLLSYQQNRTRKPCLLSSI